jgi:hypothetical protein
LEGIPPTHILNYDETNLTDDPGRRKAVFRRGTKYPERIMNSTKSSTSVMFAGTASGQLLPPYVVYKSKNLYDTWTIGGPEGTRFNRSKSGWFDIVCFSDWFFKIALPYFRRMEGNKIMIGDNLSSHLSIEVIHECEKNGIQFVFLPANSTHMTQPLDVAVFRPMKIAWRKILETWKNGPGRNSSSIPKEEFPKLLKKLMNQIDNGSCENLKSGFTKCGINPIDRNKVLSRLPIHPSTRDKQDEPIVMDSLTTLLKEMRYGPTVKPTRKKKLQVTAGKSVTAADLEMSDCEDEAAVSAESETSDHGNESNDDDRVDEFNGELVVGSWVIVNFGNSDRKRKLYIGNVEKVFGKATAEGIFLRETFRGDGTTFSFPVKEDRTEFSVSQVVRVIDEPVKLRRGVLQFKTNLRELM